LNKLYEQNKASESKGPGRVGQFFFNDRRTDFEGFVKSLSDSQKDLMRSQGYLKVSDLTSEQRKMLGIEGDPGHFQLQYEKDGVKIIVKSE
jgi:hypothetical protein